MQKQVFLHRSYIPAPAEAVFRWHARPGALERLTPPWESVKIIENTGGIEDGARVVLRMKLGPISQRWVAEHRDYEDGRQFRDVQVSGPFAHWEHTHKVESDGPSSCYLEDRIEYALPFGALGKIGGDAFTRAKLKRMFTYRHQVTKWDILQQLKGKGTMRIAVSGASGLVGSVLATFLTTAGHQVVRLIRSAPRPGSDELQWDTERGVPDLTRLEGIDAVVHLAGANIANGRWTPERKRLILESRVKGTKALCEALANLASPPKTLVCASAIGYYGNRGADMLGEDSAPGTGFLAEVCKEWETATQPAEAKGIRVAYARIGVVLTPAGGALAKMLLPFRLGIGGVIGDGAQYMSWITLDDVVGALHHVLITEDMRGPVNIVAPTPVTNHEFTKTLGRVLKRPTVVPIPAFAVRLGFGEMADELLLASTRVEPRRLLATGYEFRYPTLEEALRQVLGKT
ncbi:MAG: TIGR01777 family oxidoreductase [Candidatus Binatia bacterium]